jgi:hypothetical protein
MSILEYPEMLIDSSGFGMEGRIFYQKAIYWDLQELTSTLHLEDLRVRVGRFVKRPKPTLKINLVCFCLRPKAEG